MRRKHRKQSTLCTKRKHDSHWAVDEWLSSEEKKNCCSDVGLADLSSWDVWVVWGSRTDRGWSWCLVDDLILICLVADGTIKPDGITVERLKFAGKSKNDDDDEEVVEAGDIGVNVREDDEHVEFVGLGHILGEFGGGNKSISGCWIGLKCVWSLPLLVDEEDERDGGTDDRRLRDCWVVRRLVLDSIKPGEGDSLQKSKNFNRKLFV